MKIDQLDLQFGTIIGVITGNLEVKSTFVPYGDLGLHVEHFKPKDLLNGWRLTPSVQEKPEGLLSQLTPAQVRAVETHIIQTYPDVAEAVRAGSAPRNSGWWTFNL